MGLVRLTQIQMDVTEDRQRNIRHARTLIDQASAQGSEIVCLPEMFTTPYDNDYFKRFAETDDGETASMLRDAALKNRITLVGGSFPELDGPRLYNTSLIIGPDGEVLGKHRKMHLFDIAIEGKFSFKESDTLSAGNGITVVDTPVGRIGVAICFDIRFPELFRLMVLQGARIILVPAAFNTTTGPAHWHMLARCRAVDNQAFVALTSPSRSGSVFKSYGHSLVSDPWGTVLSEADEDEALLTTDVDLEVVETVRRELPFLSARRNDVYTLNASIMPQNGNDI